jgi:hypothetical protein
MASINWRIKIISEKIINGGNNEDSARGAGAAW